MSLSFVLLALLSRKPNSGYGLGRVLRCDLDHVWGARLQQIYSDLAKLESEGFVTCKVEPLPNRPAKKCYSLTAAGHAELDRWLAEPPAQPSARDELLARLYCADRVPREVVVRRLEEHRERSRERVHELRDKIVHAGAARAIELGLLITLEAALAQAEARVEWTTRVLSLLYSQPATAA